MSLATAGGLGGAGAGAMGGGLVMAHQANAVGQPVQPTPPPQASSAFGSAPPPSAAALGADLVDKQQNLSLKQARDLSKYPLVGVDLYGSEPCVAYFPPKPEDPANQPRVELIGKMKSSVVMKASEASHKTLRKWLSKTKTYSDVQKDTLGKSGEKGTVTIEDPQRWIGLRRLSDAPAYLRSKVKEDDSITPVIAEESSLSVGVTMSNGTLDGSTPQGDDYDRVVTKVRLNESKKALSMFPEESLQLVLNQAQYHVAKQTKIGLEEEAFVDYPCAIPVPAAYCHDACVEALIEATDGTGVVFQRSTCALAGALLPGTESKANNLLEHLNQVMQAMHKAYQRDLVKNPDAQFNEEVILVLAGVTKDTAECTAIQISSPQPDNLSCVYGNYNVLTTVSYRTEDPMSRIEQCISEVYENLDTLFPEADNPVGFITYGTVAEQKAIKDKWSKLQLTLEDWEKLLAFSTKIECISLGASILGGVSHGRIYRTVTMQGKKPKAQLSIKVQNVAPVALGVKINYHGGNSDKWQPVKTIFDFDRRVPAGPYAIDLNAAECAVYRDGKLDLNEEALLKAIKANEGSKHIPKREEAALNLRVQILQKLTRDGEWQTVGDVMSPLVQKDKDENKIACERVALELTMGSTGQISHALVGERESVVQAVKTARNSALQWYIGVFLAVAFFGGFLIKSYWEERVFERDTRRLLAYYKHVIPGSISDGDLNNARYLVWKYRNKKEKLWINLENKYGAEVLHEHEWPEMSEEEEDANASGDNEETNLDDEESTKEQEQEQDL